MRHVVFHYHFFKNAGTSVDVLLQQNFPGLWASKEFTDNHYSTNSSACTQWVKQEQQAVAFSSHTALLPPPEIDGITFFPIVFVRHPIDRIASAYDFERKQNFDTSGSLLARETDLKGYIETQLRYGKYSQCRNFHLSKIKHLFNKQTDPVDFAITFFDALPFVGLVERYSLSISRLIAWLRPYFPSIKPVIAAENVNRGTTEPLELKLEKIHGQIGDDLYRQLLTANAGDLALYEHIRNKYEQNGTASW